VDALETARYYAPKLLKVFIRSCAHSLKQKGLNVQASGLDTIILKISPIDDKKTSLKNIGLFISNIKSDLSAVLKDIPKATVDSLLQKNKSWHMGDLGVLTDFEREIDTANRIDNTDKKDEALERICLSLAQAGRFDKAIALADTINSPSYKEIALERISLYLANAKQFERAIGLAFTISGPCSRDDALERICLLLVRDERYDEAIAIADKIKISDRKDYALERISLSLSLREQKVFL
jgi:tetratricopeptide (TPR) repeat protein